MAEPLKPPKLRTSDELGDVNRGRIIEALRDNGPMTRAELAVRIGATRAGISNLTQSLLDADIIAEGPPRLTGGRGKPGRPLALAAHQAFCLGVVVLDIGVIEAALVAPSGRVLQRRRTSFTSSAVPLAALVGAIIDAAEPLLGQAGPLVGGFVGIPGITEPSGRVRRAVHLPSLDGVDLRAQLSDALALDITVENTSRAEATAEAWFGDGRGCDAFVSVHTGEGLAATVVRGGVTWRSKTGNVAEIGHTSFDPAGARCRCGQRGCWETTAALTWLRTEARRLHLPGPRTMTSARLVQLAKSQTPGAADLLRQLAENLAPGLAALTHILGPEKIILHGDVAAGGEPLRAAVESATRRRVIPALRESVRVTTSALGPDAPLLGAAGALLSTHFHMAQ
jgi:predicted NBD/HSP70 family sugar kinase